MSDVVTTGAKAIAAAAALDEKKNPFAVRGELEVKDSATVLCVRKSKSKLKSKSKSKSDSKPRNSLNVDGGSEAGDDGENGIGMKGKDEKAGRENKDWRRSFKERFGEDAVRKSPFLNAYLSESVAPEHFEFESGWEILLGQSEVINWLKSTPEKLKTMRYAGDFKLAGGNVDKDETIEEAAKRELREEFLRPAETQVDDSDIIIRPFSVKQTRPIRSRSNLMYNFVCIAEENPWLANLDIDEVNRSLKSRREEFQAFLKLPDCPYFDYPRSKKEDVSPEVYKLEWMPLETAVEHCLTSVLPFVYVNQWQQDEFLRIKRTKRDPLIMTGATVIELESFPSVESLLEFSSMVNMKKLCEAEQWLFPGMCNEDVENEFKKRLGKNNRTNPSFKPLALIQQQREARLRHEETVGEEEEEEEEQQQQDGECKNKMLSRKSSSGASISKM